MDLDEELVFRVFKNHLIFENISGHLSLEDLKSFRGAHSGFNEAALPVILKRAKAVPLTDRWKLVNLDREQYFRLNLFPDDLSAEIARIADNTLLALKGGIRDLTTLISNSRGFPCSKFVLGTRVFCEELGNNLLLNNFLSAISGFVTELELQNEKREWFFCCHLPTLNCQFLDLKTLKIVYNGDLPANYSRDLSLIANLFGHSPNLNTLHLETTWDESFISRCLEAMQGSQWQKIRNLSMNGAIKPPDFSRLLQNSVELKCLSLKIFTGRADYCDYGAIPKAFLESQSNTLEELTISWNSTWFNCDCSFPRMSKLKTLKFENGILGQDIRFPGLSFVEQFPSLKHLSVLHHSEDIEDFFHSGMQPLTTVTTLELPNSRLSSELLEHAARIFPRVTTFAVFGRMDLLQTVDAHMKNVTELTVISGDDDQDFTQVITGYTKRELNRRRILRKHIKKIVPEPREPLSIFKRLQVLRLQNVAVNNFMCEHGLLKCTSLVTLDLMGSPSTRIHGYVLAGMRRQFKVHLKPECVLSN